MFRTKLTISVVYLTALQRHFCFQNQIRHLRLSWLQSRHYLGECLIKEGDKSDAITKLHTGVLLQAFQRNQFLGTAIKEELAKQTGTPESRMQDPCVNRTNSRRSTVTHLVSWNVYQGNCQDDKDSDDTILRVLPF
ncbi:hypothetical protein P7K49_023423 [Saguinus oedipus]|uniref:Uncharacterized protein n=1 Tax=Saguinus oedipus TaxID=9490 RepID=A0ABQ9UNX5_SAGOE|nr:hypothetical protein P7K49_023423 [Saguinus oedipus]